MALTLLNPRTSAGPLVGFSGGPYQAGPGPGLNVPTPAPAPAPQGQVVGFGGGPGGVNMISVPSSYLGAGTSAQIPTFNPMLPGGGFYPQLLQPQQQQPQQQQQAGPTQQQYYGAGGASFGSQQAARRSYAQNDLDPYGITASTLRQGLTMPADQAPYVGRYNVMQNPPGRTFASRPL